MATAARKSSTKKQKSPTRHGAPTRRDRYFQQRYPCIEAMEIIHRHAGGIDLGGKTSHFVAIEIDDTVEVREFGMVTSQLIALAEYLLAHGITTVALESTGVYWIPVCAILESYGIEVFLVNPSHAKHVPGRKKSDKLDCRWLQKLHKYGLLSASFRPAEDIQPLRSFLRHRLTLVQQAADTLRRMQKVLDMMNVRIHKAVTDLGGQTGMRIVRAIVAGETDPAVLARLRDPRCKCTEEELREELTGFYQAHLVRQLTSWLRVYEALLQEIALVDTEIEAVLQALAPVQGSALSAQVAAAPHPLPTGKHAPSFNAAAYVELITGEDPTVIPGIGPQIALGLLGELGREMTRWPTEKQFGAYLALAPQPKISGGKVLSCKTRPGTHPAAVLCKQAAAAVIKKTDSALAAFYRRLAVKIGKGKALTALAYKIARMYYHLLKEGRAYVEVGVAAYEEKYRQQQVALLHKRAQQLGFTVTPVEA